MVPEADPGYLEILLPVNLQEIWKDSKSTSVRLCHEIWRRPQTQNIDISYPHPSILPFYRHPISIQTGGADCCQGDSWCLTISSSISSNWQIPLRVLWDYLYPSDFVRPLLQAESETNSLYNSKMENLRPLLQPGHRMGEKWRTLWTLVTLFSFDTSVLHVALGSGGASQVARIALSGSY